MYVCTGPCLFRSLLNSDRSAEEFALDLAYRDILPSESTDRLRSIFALEDMIEGPDYTPLLRIVIGQSSRVLLDELDEHPESINVVNPIGITPLRWALIRKNVGFAKTLIEYGADPSIADSQGRTAFHECARTGTAEFAKLLLAPPTSGGNHNNSSNNNNNNNRTNHPSFRSKHLINAPDAFGVSPWHVAVRYNSPGVLQLYVQHGCDISLKKNISRSVLHLAADLDLLEILDLRRVCIESPEIMAGESVLGWTPERFLLGRLDGEDPYAKYCSTADQGAFRRLSASVESLLHDCRVEMAVKESGRMDGAGGE